MPLSPDTIDDLPTEEGLFPIRTVCSVTGIHPVTLRAWERRYGLIRPKRTPKGHRLYSAEDIELIKRVLRLLDQGVSIGQVGHLLETQEIAAQGSPDEQQRGDQSLSGHRVRLREAIGRLDILRVIDTWEEALSLFSLEAVLDQLALPVQRSLRDRPAADPVCAAELAFYNRWLRQTLYARLRQWRPVAGGVTVIAVPLHESREDLGLIRFALACQRAGIHAHLLDAGAPSNGLKTLADRSSARALVFYSQTMPANMARLPQTLGAKPNAALYLCVYGPGFDPLPAPLEGLELLNLGTEPDEAVHRLHGCLTSAQS